MKPLTFWKRLGRAVRDRSFIVGSALVAFFLLVAVLGPELAPHNPYLRDRIQIIDGEMQRAPFPPSGLYPLGTDDQGRDMLSMLLYGARQTLVIAFVAMTARLLLGFLLGTLAGWWPGSLFDRAVAALTEFLAAIPGLILAILLVLAIGIRRGQISFIVALSLVGWGEVTQIVRGHVLVMRNRLYILAARAVGLGTAEIFSRHVLPNLLATLLALAALEMGGVLLLLGELGFVHIFIGGGGVYADEATGLIHYFDVPDWGAMLGTSWRYFRSLPWLPMAPALAFFVAILGFNLFGYGLQRFIEKGRFHPSGWPLLRFFAVVALVLLGARALLASTGIEAQFVKMAHQFDVQRAWNDISYLTQPRLEGRPTGPGGGFEAAGYIAYQFEQAGLTPLPRGGYYQSYVTACGIVTAPPALEVLGADGEPRMRFEDDVTLDPLHPFAAEMGGGAELMVPGSMRGGNVGELVVLGNARANNVIENPAGTVLLLLDAAEEPPRVWFRELPFVGVLRVVPDEQLARGNPPPPYTSAVYLSHFPNLLIGESAARRMLAEAGLDFGDLQAALEAGDQIVLPTGLWIRLETGLFYERTSAVNVVGYFPAADMRTQGERILVITPYTGPFPQGETIYPGADENASAVAVMLEVARLWRDLGFEPKRTVVFAAVDVGGEDYFMNHPALPASAGDTWTVVILRGLGAGGSRLARLEAGYGLARAFDQSARRFGVGTEELATWQFFFAGSSPWARPNPAYSGLMVTRLGDDPSGTPADTLGHLDPQLLAEAGRVIVHYLMVLANR